MLALQVVSNTSLWSTWDPEKAFWQGTFQKYVQYNVLDCQHFQMHGQSLVLSSMTGCLLRNFCCVFQCTLDNVS